MPRSRPVRRKRAIWAAEAGLRQKRLNLDANLFEHVDQSPGHPMLVGIVLYRAQSNSRKMIHTTGSLIQCPKRRTSHKTIGQAGSLRVLLPDVNTLQRPVNDDHATALWKGQFGLIVSEMPCWFHSSIPQAASQDPKRRFTPSGQEFPLTISRSLVTVATSVTWKAELRLGHIALEHFFSKDERSASRESRKYVDRGRDVSARQIWFHVVPVATGPCRTRCPITSKNCGNWVT